MEYVKLTARPDTWFVAGTEAYTYESDYVNKSRVTLKEFKEDWEPYGTICVRGTRISECQQAENVPVGEEYFDGESCMIDEFDVEIVTEKN